MSRPSRISDRGECGQRDLLGFLADTDTQQVPVMADRPSDRAPETVSGAAGDRGGRTGGPLGGSGPAEGLRGRSVAGRVPRRPLSEDEREVKNAEAATATWWHLYRLGLMSEHVSALLGGSREDRE